MKFDETYLVKVILEEDEYIALSKFFGLWNNEDDSSLLFEDFDAPEILEILENSKELIELCPQKVQDSINKLKDNCTNNSTLASCIYQFEQLK